MLDISDGKVRGGFRVNFGKAGMMVGIYFSVFFTANFADRLPAASGRAADMAVADDRAVVRNVEAAVNGSFDGEGDPGGNGEAGTIGKCQRRAGGYGRVAGERVVPDDGWIQESETEAVPSDWMPVCPSALVASTMLLVMVTSAVE